MNRRQFIKACRIADTKELAERKAELAALIEAWETGNIPERDWNPNGLMSMSDYRLEVFFLARQIFFREKCLKDPNEYEKDWAVYKSNRVSA